MRAALIIALLAGPAAAHDWYPQACCSMKDCFPIPIEDVEYTPDGWYIRSTGETVPFDRTRTTPADGGGQFHRCSYGGNPTAPTIMLHSAIPGRAVADACFWAPMMGS